MPIRAFWLMHNGIPRMQAENDLRLMTVSGAVQSSEGNERLRANLVLELDGIDSSGPRPISEERDEEGFADLKAMAL